MRTLIRAGGDVNARSQHGWTLLMLAALAACTPIAICLLSHGADVSATNDFGTLELAYTTLKGHGRTVQVLPDAGGPINVSPHGKSLIEFANWGGGRTDRHSQLLRRAGRFDYLGNGDLLGRAIG